MTRPVACILLQDDTAICGRPCEDEFAFVNPGHAFVSRWRNRPTLVCPACAEGVIRILRSESMDDLCKRCFGALPPWESPPDTGCACDEPQR